MRRALETCGTTSRISAYISWESQKGEEREKAAEEKNI